jgi:hypothetical protein
MAPLWLHAEESMPEFAPDLRLVLDRVSRSACTAYTVNLWLWQASTECHWSPPISNCLARFLLSQSL